MYIQELSVVCQGFMTKPTH